MKILYLHPARESSKRLYPEYYKRVEEIIKKVIRRDTTFEIRLLSEGVPEDDQTLYWYAQPRFFGEMIAVAKKAEKEGFDVAVIGCCGSFPAILGVKEALVIPVVGAGEAAFHLAQILGHNFAVLTYNRKVAAWCDKIVHYYSLESKCVSIRPAHTTLMNVFAAGTDVHKAFLEQAKKAIDEDRAEVIITLSTGQAGVAQYLRKHLEAPVVDPIEAGVKFAEMLADLNKATGLIQSRIACYQPSPDTEKFLKSSYPEVYR